MIERKVVLCGVCIFAVLGMTAACGKKEETKQVVAVTTSTNQPAPTTSAAVVTENPASKVSDSERLSIEFINVFLNGTNKEEMEKFLKDKIHADSQPLYQLVVSMGAAEPEKNVYRDPVVVESTKIDDQGKQVDLLLITGKDDAGKQKEIITMIKDGKFMIALTPNSTAENDKKAYSELREKFKTKKTP